MTTDSDFDRIASAWLDLMPDEVPDRVIADVLLATATSPQVRRPLVRGPRRSASMNRFALIGTAAVLVATLLGVVMLLGGGSRGSVPGPEAVASSTPTADPTDPPAAAAMPESLFYRWIGEERDIPGLGRSSRTALNFTSDTFALSGTTYGLGGIMRSTPTSDGRSIHLVSTSTTGGCSLGDEGSYDWSLSAGGTRLTVDAGQDACAARAAAMPGTWYRVACMNTSDGCWGDLEAGTYPSQYIDPRLDIGAVWEPQLGAFTYTVPDGWANSSDWPNTFSLTPSSDYAHETADGPLPDASHEVFMFTQPVPAIQSATCDGRPDLNADRSVRGLLAYLRSLDGLTVSNETHATIDGHPATTVDLAIAPDTAARCPDVTGPAMVLVSQAGDRQDNYVIGVGGDERVRMTLVDLGGGDVLGIDIDSSDPATFDALATAAQPIIDSIRFK